MPDQELNQQKDEAKEEVSKLSFKMVKSAITDFTSAITSIPSIVFGPIVSSVKNLFSSDNDGKGFFSNILDGFKKNISTFVDKINPFPELFKAKDTKDKLNATIEESDDIKAVENIRNNVESVKKEVDFQAKANAVRTVTNIITSAIPGGAIAKGVTGDLANAVAGGVVSEIIEDGIESSAKIVDFTEITPTMSIQEHKTNKVLDDVLDTSLNPDTVKILDSSSNNAIKDNLLVMEDQELDNTNAVLADEFVKARENNSANPSLSIA
jgi:hypothetical protein